MGGLGDGVRAAGNPAGLSGVGAGGTGLVVRTQQHFLCQRRGGVAFLARAAFAPADRWVLFAAGVSVSIAIAVCLGCRCFCGSADFSMAIALPADIAVLGCAVLPPALLWGYSDRLWCWGQRGGAPLFQPVARRLAVLFLAFLLYLLSFPWFWQRIAIRSETTFFPELPWFTIADIVITTGITLIEWIHTTYVSLTRQLSAQAQMHTVGVAAILTACALAVYWRLGIAPLEDGTGAIARTQGVTAIFAVLFLLLASELIRSGWRLGERSLFVGGTALLTLRAYAQALPHLQGLVAMALVFLICGGGTLALGLWFEQVARHRESVSLSRSLSNPMSAPEDAP
ncbi:MAG: hypothetical protein HC925_04600 [Coleofasciculaceae cyanobacterium SM2_3_26]|nr:hypothetical protein [Coleofasciculaceae cyanobacterium SM2_3_26]